MNSFLFRLGRLASLVLLAGGLSAQGAPAPAPAPTPVQTRPGSADFAKVGEAVLRLLETKDTEKFARELAPSLEDWKAVRSTNTANALPGEDPLGAGFQRTLDGQRRQLQESARQLLATAAELGVNKAKFTVKVIVPPRLGNFRQASIQGENESLKFAQQLEIKLTGEPGPEGGAKLRGDYSVTLNSGLKFPAGWRFFQGVCWTSMPTTVGGDKQLKEMALANRLSRPGPLGLADDPALAKPGEAVMQLLRDRDEKAFAAGALRSLEEQWATLQAEAKKQNQMLPPKPEFEKAWGEFQKRMLESAHGMLEQADKVGIDLRGAEIRLADAKVGMAYRRGEKVDGNQMRFYLEVKSDHKTQAGKSISGTYVVTATRGEKVNYRWVLEDRLRWEKFPDGLLGEKELAELKFENHVAEFGTLPPGTSVPKIEFVRVDNEAKAKLEDFKGKVVLLEFWATWCGPCQEPMARMQTLSSEHPEWKDKVEIVSLSIDDELAQARTHLNERGWTNTVNMWAGPGGWSATPAKEFRVRGVPTCYLIDAQGKVVQAGHPASIDAQLGYLMGKLLK